MNQTIKFKKERKLSNSDKSQMVYGKLPPQALDIESAILGAMMIDATRIEDVIGIIPDANCFYNDANQRIYASIRRLFDKGSRIDFLTVTEDLRRNSELELVGGAYYVTTLTRDVVSSAHIEEHARIVMQKYILREMIRISAEIQSDAYEDMTDAFELLEKLHTQLNRLTEDNIKNEYRHISHEAAHDIQVLEEQKKKNEENDSHTLTGVPTGFKTINKITNGWQKGDLIILAARPAVGKTAFSLNLVMNANVPVGFFSMEMKLQSIRKRINSMKTKIGLTNINSCKLEDSDFEKLRDNLNKLNNLPLYVDDTSMQTVHDIKAKVRRMKKKHGVELIVIDYLQLISSKSWGNREQQIAEISRELKTLAMDLDIPIIALSQMSRDVEKRKGEPMLSDLRESGAIEQDADLVAFLYWFDKNIRFKLAKHRNGKLDIVDFVPNLDIQMFKEIGEDFPELEIKGYEPTSYSGRLIPMSEAIKKDDEEELPF